MTFVYANVVKVAGLVIKAATGTEADHRVILTSSDEYWHEECVFRS